MDSVKGIREKGAGEAEFSFLPSGGRDRRGFRSKEAGRGQ